MEYSGGSNPGARSGQPRPTWGVVSANWAYMSRYCCWVVPFGGKKLMYWKMIVLGNAATSDVALPSRPVR
jgi:hypothetical protein